MCSYDVTHHYERSRAKMLEVSFEYVTDIDGKKLFRKRK